MPVITIQNFKNGKFYDLFFRLWDFREAMRSVAIFQGHNASVNAVVFNSTNQLISSSDDRTIKVKMDFIPN
jgi:WD40 repeat protein